MQVTIARQLGLDPSTVSNFFMNARRRSVDKWKDDRMAGGDPNSMYISEGESGDDEDYASSPQPPSMQLQQQQQVQQHHQQQQALALTRYQDGTIIKTMPTNASVLVTSANPAAVVQHMQQGDSMTPTATLDL
jgi:hypothetical protein